MRFKKICRIVLIMVVTATMVACGNNKDSESVNSSMENTVTTAQEESTTQEESTKQEDTTEQEDTTSSVAEYASNVEDENHTNSIMSALPKNSEGEKAMDYIGKWKFHSVMTYDDNNNAVFLTAEEYLNSPMPYIDENDEDAVADEIKERKRMIKTSIKICDDGSLYMLMPLPDGVSQEEIDKAVSEGEIKLVDGEMADEPMSWELRDGELWFDTGIEGEVYGEKSDSWVKPIDEDGFFYFMNFRFIKED